MKDEMLDKEVKDLTTKAHEIESAMHSFDTGCMTENMDHLREALIDVTMKLDDIEQNMGESIKIRY
ncbi:MAG: hypothetical protein ACYC56_06380 [Candidatus Aquicultor sp.]